MPDVKVELSKDEIDRLVQAHIFDALGPEKRDAMMREAIAKLLVPDRNNASPLQEAFRWAADRYMRDFLKTELEKPDSKLTQETKLLFEEAWNRTFNEPSRREKLVEKMSTALARALMDERY